MPKHELTRELWHVTVVNLEKIQGIEEYQRLTDIASEDNNRPTVHYDNLFCQAQRHYHDIIIMSRSEYI